MHMDADWQTLCYTGSTEARCLTIMPLTLTPNWRWHLHVAETELTQSNGRPLADAG
jgi:hypothetical protein